MQETHYGQTVNAFFGFSSKFSKKALPGISHQEMSGIHTDLAKHHKSQLLDLAKQHHYSDSWKERRSLKKQINWHNNQMQKHSKLASHFLKTNPNKVKIAPAISKPEAEQAKPAPSKLGTEPSFSPEYKPQVMFKKPVTDPTKPGYDPGKYLPTDFDSLPKPIYHKKSIVDLDNDQGHEHEDEIEPEHANTWHDMTPEHKEDFVNNHPNNVMSKANETLHPRIPLKSEDLAKGHEAQARHYHTKFLKHQSEGNTGWAKHYATKAQHHANLAIKARKLPDVDNQIETEKPPEQEPDVSKMTPKEAISHHFRMANKHQRQAKQEGDLDPEERKFHFDKMRHHMKEANSFKGLLKKNLGFHPNLNELMQSGNKNSGSVVEQLGRANRQNRPKVKPPSTVRPEPKPVKRLKPIEDDNEKPAKAIKPASAKKVNPKVRNIDPANL
ncbi:MAG: hypothetical protein KGH75_03865 [Rhodospirillales bacterium]|nr:hypothetical protein [Rhodospirillales bacterium]